MHTYWGVLRFYAQRWLVYPLEIITELVKYLVRVFGLYLFWYLVLENSSRPESAQDLLSYFLVSAAVGMLTMTMNTSMGRELRHAIKRGYLSNTVIKPTSILAYYLALTWGKRSALFVMMILGATFGLTLLPALSFINLIFFTVSFVIALVLGFSLNVLEGVLAVYVTEVTGIKNMIAHTIRLFSGALVPLSFFPQNLQQIVSYTPFPAMIYGPTRALLSSNPLSELPQMIIVGAVWAVIFLFVSILLWTRALKHYEAVGQ